eukprot:g3773.t1
MSHPKERFSILFVCDFFYPRLGGVEMHQYSLAQCLIQRGHKVVVLTHNYKERSGVRYMTNGLKVYYAPIAVMADQCTFPTLYGIFPLFRQILLREEIDIVHGHQATSQLTHECILHAGTMGYKVVYTDHSLFGFADAASIHANKVLKFTLSGIDHAICVSHTCRENLVLRASLKPNDVSAIPNAVDTSKFTPKSNGKKSENGRINVVIVSRLAFRKGIDLLVNVIPIVCRRHSNVNFIIGGDGPKRLLLDEMREKYQLHDRVEMLGAVPHKEVRNVLVRGHVFLNCSLTESFCIAILEAAACGLYVVSTRVGGVPEVLPPHMITFAETDPNRIASALSSSFQNLKNVDPEKFHQSISKMYNWMDVAARTEIVYKRIAKLPTRSFVDRLFRYYNAGFFFGPLCCIIITLDYFFWKILETLMPAEDTEIAANFMIPGSKEMQSRVKSKSTRKKIK